MPHEPTYVEQRAGLYHGNNVVRSSVNMGLFVLRSRSRCRGLDAKAEATARPRCSDFSFAASRVRVIELRLQHHQHDDYNDVPVIVNLECEQSLNFRDYVNADIKSRPEQSFDTHILIRWRTPRSRIWHPLFVNIYLILALLDSRLLQSRARTNMCRHSRRAMCLHGCTS